MYYDFNPIEKDGERNIWCQYYEDCLDYAVKKDWRSWDCSACKHLLNQKSKIGEALQGKGQRVFSELQQ